MHLSWTAPADGGSPITSYKIYRGTAPGSETLYQTLGTGTSYDDRRRQRHELLLPRRRDQQRGEGTQSNEVSATPVPPPTPFPSTGVLDSFNRAAGSLGAELAVTRPPGRRHRSITSSGQTGATGGAGSATWSAGQFGADQEAYLTVPVLPTAGNFLQVAGRVSTLSASNVSCYFLRVTPATSSWDLRYKLNGNSSVSLGTFSAPFTAGDGMGLRITGSSLTAYRKPGAGAWTQVGTASDSQISTGGYLSYTLGDTTARGGAFGGGTVTGAAVPSAPTLSVTAGDAQNALSWNAPANGGSAITNYKVFRGTSAGGETLLTTLGNVTSFTDTGAVNGTRYYYKVAAVNSVGDGAQSNEVNAMPSPSISIADVSRAEGNSGQADLTFTATLTNPSSQPVTVAYATQDGTATTAGSDYAAATGTLTFDPGATTESVAVKVNGDNTFEPNEGFTINLSSPTNASITDAIGAGTITNDDAQPTISIADVTASEGNSGTTNFVFTLSLSNPSYQTITVNRQTQDGTATSADSDYGALAPAPRSFAPGDTTTTTTIGAFGDSKFEPDENFLVKLSGATNATIADDTGVGTIQNDDAVPQAIVNDVTHLEGNSSTTAYTFTVALSNPSYQSVMVDYATQDGAATVAGSDYAAASGTLTFTTGQTAKTVTVNANGDTLFEPDEDFRLRLPSSTNATIADDTGVGTIQNDDAQPALSVSDVATAEGNLGTANLAFTVSLGSASGQPVSVAYATQDGTATTTSGDYAATSGNLTFTPGQVSKTVNVPMNGDITFEPDETLALNLSGASGATVSDGTGQGTIQNDDPQPQISVDDVSHLEGNSAQTAYTFTVSLSNPSYQAIGVTAHTEDGTATTADSDYAAIASQAVSFAPGETQKQVTVNANGDTKFEADETFALKLAGPSNATIADDTGTGTVRDDDGQPRWWSTTCRRSRGTPVPRTSRSPFR